MSLFDQKMQKIINGRLMKHRMPLFERANRVRTRKPSAFVRVATVEDVVNTVKFCVKIEVMEKVIGGIYSVYTFILEKNLLRFMLSILRLEFCLHFSNVHTK